MAIDMWGVSFIETSTVLLQENVFFMNSRGVVVDLVREPTVAEVWADG